MRKAAGVCVVELSGAAAPNKGWRDFLLVRDSLLKAMVERWPTSGDAKIMTARSPDDSAGEHNNGSGWTANLPSE